MSEQNQSKDKLSDVQEKELPTWAVVIRLIIETIDRLIWLVVLGIIAAIIGTLIISQPPKVAINPDVYNPIIKPVQWEQVDQAIQSDLIAAHNEVEQYASSKLDTWISELMVKVDDNFIPWYFGYWNQQALGLKSLFQTAYRWFNGNAPTAEETLNQIIETEFTNRVLQPQTAQLQIKILTDESVNLYIKNL